MKKISKELKDVLIAFIVVVLLVIDYFVSVLIAKLFNVYNVNVTSLSAIYSDITWEIFIFMLFILVEVFIVDEIYRKRNNIK